jgi:hypothetical protein
MGGLLEFRQSFQTWRENLLEKIGSRFCCMTEPFCPIEYGQKSQKIGRCKHGREKEKIKMGKEREIEKRKGD